MTFSDMLSQRTVIVVDFVAAVMVTLVLRSLLLYNINKDMFNYNFVR
jgi:hypothetical protein